MGVDLAGDVGAAVVEAVADDVDVDAFLQGEGGPGVAEAVELQPRERLGGMGLVVGLLLAEELAAEPLGVDRGAIGAGEDPAVVVVAGAEEALDLRLAFPCRESRFLAGLLSQS